MIKAIQLIFYLLLYFHLKACLWYFICASNKIWSPPLDWVYYSAGNKEMQLRIYSEELTTFAYKYWIAFYNSVIFIKGNEIGPRSAVEIIVCTIILMLDCIVAGNIFGSVAVLV